MQVISRRKLASYAAAQLAKGDKKSDIVQQLAAYLIERKQTASAELLIRDIERVLAADHGIVMAEIISSRELSASLLKTIEQFVAKSEDAKQVEVSTSIDPSLLGGVIIRTPRSELDASVRTKLNALRR